MDTPRFHIVFSGPTNVEKIRNDAANGHRPRHLMIALAEALDARIWTPDLTRASERTFADRISAIPPFLAALADDVVSAAKENDVIFCISEGASLPIADRLIRARKNTKLAGLGHNLIRPRMALLRMATPVLNRHDLIFTVSHSLHDGLQRRLGRHGQVEYVNEQIDDQFFTPGPASKGIQRPILAGVGLEKRDYRSLAAAASQLNVDIKISGFSNDTHRNARALPDPLPSNMDQRFYEWPDLAQLYRDAALIVVPVFENDYAAGINNILEAMASRRAVIASASRGLKGLITDENAICWTPPGDRNALGKAIEYLLNNPEKREAMAERGYRLFKENHSFNDRCAAIESRLRALRD